MTTAPTRSRTTKARSAAAEGPAPLRLVASLWDLGGTGSPRFPAQSATCDPCGAVFTDAEAVSFADLKLRAYATGWVIDGPWKVCPRCAPSWHLDEPSGVVARITAQLAQLPADAVIEAAHQTVLVHDEPATVELWQCPGCGDVFTGVNDTHSPCNDTPRDDNNWTVPPVAAEPQASGGFIHYDPGPHGDAVPFAVGSNVLVHVTPSPPVAEPLNQERTDEDDRVWQTWTGPTVTSGNGDGNGIGELDEDAERHFTAAFEDTPDSPDVPGPVELPPDVPGPGTPAKRQADEAFDQAAGGAE